MPSAGWTGTVDPGIVFRVWDLSSGSNGGAANTTINGGTMPFSVATETARIVVYEARVYLPFILQCFRVDVWSGNPEAMELERTQTQGLS